MYRGILIFTTKAKIEEIRSAFHLRVKPVRIFCQMERYKFSATKRRQDECVPFGSICKPSSGKDCPISFSIKMTAYLIKEHQEIVWEKKWHSDFPIIPVKMRRGIPQWKDPFHLVCHPKHQFFYKNGKAPQEFQISRVLLNKPKLPWYYPNQLGTFFNQILQFVKKWNVWMKELLQGLCRGSGWGALAPPLLHRKK